MKLISMTDYVLEQPTPDWLELCEFEENSRKIHEYAVFLKQPITIGMFVPCDSDGGVLEIPTHYGEWESEFKKGFEHQYEGLIMQKYQQAKSKVLFNGFEVKKLRASHLYELFRDDKFLFTYNSSTDTFLIVGSTIENLIKYNLDLSVSF